MSKNNPQIANYGAYEVKERWAQGWGRCIDTTHIDESGARTIIQSTVGLSDWIWPHVWREKCSQADTWSKGEGVKHVGGRKITGEDMVKQAHDRRRAMERANERARNWSRDRAAEDVKAVQDNIRRDREKARKSTRVDPRAPDDKRPRGAGTEDDPYKLSKGERHAVAFIFDKANGQLVLRVYKNKPSYDPKSTVLPKGAELTTGPWRDNPRWAEMSLEGVTKKIWWTVK